MSPTKVAAITKRVTAPIEVTHVPLASPKLKIRTVKPNLKVQSPLSPEIVTPKTPKPVKVTTPITPRTPRSFTPNYSPKKKEIYRSQEQHTSTNKKMYTLTSEEVKETIKRAEKGTTVASKSIQNKNDIQKQETITLKQNHRAKQQLEIRRDETLVSLDQLLRSLKNEKLKQLHEKLRSDYVATKSSRDRMTNLRMSANVEEVLAFKSMLTMCDLFKDFAITEEQRRLFGTTNTKIQRIIDNLNATKTSIRKDLEELELHLTKLRTNVS
jgi:hypothetical protein